MKKSILDEFKKLQEDQLDRNFTSHFLIGIDISSDGSPNSSMTLSSGKPFEVLGMIELLILNLQNIKEDILKTLSQKENQNQDSRIEKLLSNLPEELRNKIKSIKDRMEKAVDNLDKTELENCKQELETLQFNHLNNQKNDDDDDDDDKNRGFNINDFKGGIA